MFQLSLSTSLTPLATPGTGPVPMPTAAFTVALAGAAGAIEAPPTGALAAAEPRQAPAEAGKKLPTAADTSDALAWLDAGQTLTSARPIGLNTLSTNPAAESHASPMAQAVDRQPGQPIGLQAIETPAASMPVVSAISPAVVTPVVVASASASIPATADSIAPSTGADEEMPATLIAADIAVATPVLSKKTAANRAGDKAPKHHDRPASRSKPDAAPIILAADAATIAVVAAPPPAAAPASPKEASAPDAAAPISSSLATSRSPAQPAVRLPLAIDAKTFGATPRVDDALAPDVPMNDKVATDGAQTPDPFGEKIATPDVAQTGVLAPSLPGSVSQPASRERSVTPSLDVAPLRAASPLSAHNAEPVVTSPAPGPQPISSPALSEVTPIIEQQQTPAIKGPGPAPVDGKVAAPVSSVRIEPRLEAAIIRPERATAPTVRDTATSPAPAATPVIASASPTSAAASSPKQPPVPVSPAVLPAAPSDAAPAARPALQTRQSAAADPAPSSPSVATAVDPRAAAAAAPPVVQTPPQSAGVMFGIALGAPLLDRRPADRSSPREEALQALTSLAATGSASPIAAAGGAQQGALDMHRDDWPQAMIDRIEALRDAADATSTRITLAPDALGKVDLSIRHDGDAVHVHFAAEAAQTRAILADAQPRLAELAQARGLKLGQATVDAGTGGQGQRQQAAATPAQPQRPASAFTRAAADDPAVATDSTRLA